MNHTNAGWEEEIPMQEEHKEPAIKVSTLLIFQSHKGVQQHVTVSYTIRAGRCCFPQCPEGLLVGEKNYRVGFRFFEFLPTSSSPPNTRQEQKAQKMLQKTRIVKQRKPATKNQETFSNALYGERKKKQSCSCRIHLIMRKVQQPRIEDTS